jgi:hypothetical protein
MFSPASLNRMRGIRVDGVFVSGRNYCRWKRVARKEYRKEAGSFTLAVRVAHADLDDQGCDNHPNAASAKVGSVFHSSRAGIGGSPGGAYGTPGTN